MFQFPEVVDVKVGDVLQMEGSRDLWEVYEIEDKVIGGEFVNMNAWVQKKGGMIGRQQTHKPAISVGRDLHIGDKYTAEQAGAMGPQAHAHEVSLTQVKENQIENIDMKVLATELGSLRRNMRQTAESPEQDIAIGAIAAAEQAANAGDKQGVLRHLRNTGRWAADIATKIGVNVASELIKKSMQ